LSENSANSCPVLIRRSLWLGVAIGLIHLVAIAAWWSAALPVWSGITVAMVLLVNFLVQIRAHVFRNSANAIHGIDVSNARLVVCFSRGKPQPVERIRSAVLTHAIIALKLQLERRQGHSYLLIPRDAVAEQEFRELMVRIKPLVEQNSLASG
jgi:hypothetical protein